MTTIKSDYLFVNGLRTAWSERKITFAAVWTVCLLIAIGYSVLFPQYVSETLIAIQPNDDPTKLSSSNRDIPSNESFLSAQQIILLSRTVLTKTLLAYEPDHKITDKAIRKLKSSLVLSRSPLNNLITIRLGLNSEKEVQPLLETFIETYRTWYRENRIIQAKKIEHLLADEIDKRKQSLTEAEETLTRLMKENGLTALTLNEQSKNTTNRLETEEDELKNENHLLENLTRERQNIIRIIQREAGIDPSLSLSEPVVSQLQDQLVAAQQDQLRHESLYEDDASGIRTRKIQLKYIQDEFKNKLRAILSRMRGDEEAAFGQVMEKFVLIVLDELVTKARIEFLNQQLQRYREKLEQLDALTLQKYRLDRIIKIKESSYMEMLYKYEQNLPNLSLKNSDGVQLISPPSIPRKNNGLLKMCLYGLIVGLFANSIVLYFSLYAGKE